MRSKASWAFAKHRLKKCHGWRKDGFYLNLKECEFRLNHRHGDLYKTLLKTSKSTPLSSQALKRKGSGSISRHDHKPSEKCCEPHLFNPVAHIHSRVLLEYTGGLKQSQWKETWKIEISPHHTCSPVSSCIISPLLSWWSRLDYHRIFGCKQLRSNRRRRRFKWLDWNSQYKPRTYIPWGLASYRWTR